MRAPDSTFHRDIKQERVTLLFLCGHTNFTSTDALRQSYHARLVQGGGVVATTGVKPPDSLGERMALLIRSVESAFALLLTKVTKSRQRAA